MVFSVVTFSVVNRQADFTHVFATKLLLAIFVRTVATTWTIKQDIFFRIETVAFFSFVLLTFYPCIGYFWPTLFFFPNSGLRHYDRVFPRLLYVVSVMDTSIHGSPNVSVFFCFNTGVSLWGAFLSPISLKVA